MQCRKNAKEVLAAGVTNSPACKETSHAYIFRFWLETINGQDLLPIKWLTVSHKQLVLEDLTLASYTCNLSYPWDLWAFLPLLQKLHVVSPCRAASFPATAGFFLAMMPGLLPVFYFWCLSGLPAAHFPVFIYLFIYCGCQCSRPSALVEIFGAFHDIVSVNLKAWVSGCLMTGNIRIGVCFFHTTSNITRSNCISELTMLSMWRAGF